jgi:Tol biopolymer transport system component
VLEILHYKGKPEDTSITSSVIAVVDVTGADHTPRELTDDSLLAGYPFWHPTSDLIVFRSNRFDGDALLDPAKPSDLYTIKPDGSGLTKVTDNGVGGPIVRGPSWTPDGRILFGKLANLGADEFLRIINADGTGEASATGNLWTKGEGKWRPGT